jgi:ribosome-binding protein aMBF1 (putative translation factor)
MLELTKKRPTEKIILSVICDKARLPKIKAALKPFECVVRQETAARPEMAESAAEQEWMTPEEVFPGFGAGHSLRGARYREDVSQRQLSKLTGVSVQNISAMEHGRRPIGKEMAKRLAKVLNTDWRLLLS